MNATQWKENTQLSLCFESSVSKRSEIARDIRVLIACEESGTIREEFLEREFNAFSCDIKPDRNGSNRHLQCDVRDIIDDDWDAIIVAHPPCTSLCNSGVRWLTGAPPPGKTRAQMQQALEEGAELFSVCWNAKCPKVAVENPIMHRYAKALIKNFKPAHYVQPWWFGEKAFKATGFHLRNLPPLVATNKLDPPKKGTEEHIKWSAIHRAPPGPERSKVRSKTFKGIAKAIADQWGNVLIEERMVA